MGRKQLHSTMEYTLQLQHRACENEKRPAGGKRMTLLIPGCKPCKPDFSAGRGFYFFSSLQYRKQHISHWKKITQYCMCAIHARRVNNVKLSKGM